MNKPPAVRETRRRKTDWAWGEGGEGSWLIFFFLLTWGVEGDKEFPDSPLCPCPRSATLASSPAFPPASALLVWLLLTWTAAPRWPAPCVCVCVCCANTCKHTGTWWHSELQSWIRALARGLGKIYSSAIWPTHTQTHKRVLLFRRTVYLITLVIFYILLVVSISTIKTNNDLICVANILCKECKDTLF